MKRVSLLAAIVTGLGIGARPLLAQDPVKVAPNVYKVILDNDRVRVLEVTVQPGGKTPMHSHPANVVYPLTDSRVRFTLPDGKSVEADLKAGEVSWHEAESHSGENIGKTVVRAVVVELKAPKM